MQKVDSSLRALPIVETQPPPRLPFTYYDGLLVLMAIIWGTNFVVLKAATEQIPGAVFNFIRFAVGTTGVGVILYISQRSSAAGLATLRLPRQEWYSIGKLAFITGILYQSLFIHGLQFTTAANSSLIITAAPVMLVLLNAARGKDRIGRGGIIGSLLAFLGVALVIFFTHANDFALGGTTLQGDALIFLAAFVWVWSVLATKDPLARMPVLLFSFWHSAVMTVMQGVSIIPELAVFDWHRLTLPVILMILYSGVGPFCIAGLIWNRGIQTTGATRIAIYNNLQPIIAAITSTIFLGEPFTVIIFVGAVLVLVGVVLVKRG